MPESLYGKVESKVRSQMQWKIWTLILRNSVLF